MKRENSMGLDNVLLRSLNKFMKIKSWLGSLGKSFLLSFLGEQEERISPLVRERQKFEAEVKDQFLKLKEKGISIPVFTL